LILSSKLSVLSSFAVRSVLLMLCFAAMPSIAQQDATGLATIPLLVSPVIDTTDTLSADERAQLEAQSLALQRSSGAQLQILLVPSTQPEDIAVYAQRVFDIWALGRAGIDDGLLIVVAKNDRRVRIHTGIGLEGRIPDATAQRLIAEYLTPKFKRGDVAGGLNDATLVLASVMNGEPLPASIIDARLGAAAVSKQAAASSASSQGLLSAPLALAIAAFFALLFRLLLRTLPVWPKIGFAALIAAAIAFILTSSWGVAIVAAGIGAILALLSIPMPSVAIEAKGARGAARSGEWDPDELVFDPNDPDVVRRREQREQREREADDGGGISSSGSSGSWSGGGGRSGGGGASGSW
jgi:uncharacterized protein